MKKKWVAIPLMLMLIMTGTVLVACSDKEPVEEPAGRVLHVSVSGNDETGDGSGFGDPYDADYVRNGECCGNIIYNISSDGNKAYLEDGEYDLLNEFGENIWCFDCEDSFEDRCDAGDYELERLVDADKQLLIPKREDVLNGFRSIKDGKGSFFVPDEKYINLYGLKED